MITLEQEGHWHHLRARAQRQKRWRVRGYARAMVRWLRLRFGWEAA